MNLDENLKAALIQIAERYQITMYLFGSRARGDNHARSDVDLAIKGDYDATEFFKIEEAIDDLSTLLSFDLIDLNSMLINFAVRESIRKEGVPLFIPQITNSSE